MEQSSHIHGSRQLDWTDNGMRTRFLRVGKNVLPNLRTSLLLVAILTMMGMALMSALEQNTSLLHLLDNDDFSEQPFGLGGLPEIKMLQQFDLSWCTGLASYAFAVGRYCARTQTCFVLRYHCAPSSVPPTSEVTRCAGGWIRNGTVWVIQKPLCFFFDGAQPRGVWSHVCSPG
jgi:hypothetical protein